MFLFQMVQTVGLVVAGLLEPLVLMGLEVQVILPQHHRVKVITEAKGINPRQAHFWAQVEEALRRLAVLLKPYHLTTQALVALEQHRLFLAVALLTQVVAVVVLRLRQGLLTVLVVLVAAVTVD
jgi:hypothetical protein